MPTRVPKVPGKSGENPIPPPLAKSRIDRRTVLDLADGIGSCPVL